mgnify:CR=1 FL=1
MSISVLRYLSPTGGQGLNPDIRRRPGRQGVPHPAHQQYERTVKRLATLDAHPVDVDIADPITHAARHERVTRASLAQLVRFYAYSPITSAVLPLTLDEARKGHYEPLLGQLLLVQGDLSTRLDGPMELSVLCSEDAPLLTERAEDVQTVLGSGFVKEAKIACGEWPHAPMPGNFHAPLKGAVPTLILVGEFDPVTPPRYAHDIAQHLSGARVVVSTRSAGVTATRKATRSASSCGERSLS